MTYIMWNIEYLIIIDFFVAVFAAVLISFARMTVRPVGIIVLPLLLFASLSCIIFSSPRPFALPLPTPPLIRGRGPPGIAVPSISLGRVQSFVP